jgi:CubicO group peptidase (beta-lactamase class C family)
MSFDHKIFWITILIFLSACSSSGEREALFATVSNSEKSSTVATAVGTERPAGLAATISSVMTVEPGEIENLGSSGPDKTPDSVLESSKTVDMRLPELQNFLAELAVTDQFMGVVLIAQDGQVLINEGYGMADIETGRPNKSQTQLRIGSLTKQFTAAAILRLQELGRLNVNDPVSVFLPDYPGGEQITIHQLLTHSSGVPNYYTRQSDLTELVQTPILLQDLLSQFSGQPLDFSPGQRFAYSDSGYVILTAIIEAASGMSYADFLQEQFFDKLRMTKTGYDYLHDNLAEPAKGYNLTPVGPQEIVAAESSWASGAGALYSTVEDLYHWDRALNGSQVLGRNSLESMFTPWVEMGQGYSYGYGWEIGLLAGRPAQIHAGNIFGFGSFMARFPEDDAVIIILGNGLQLSPRGIAETLANILFNSSPS